MAAIFAFKCSECGQVHEGSPSFGFRAPAPFLEQPREIREASHLGTDLCWYEDGDGVHYFIRVCLEIPILGIEEPFVWGVWVSLSAGNFTHYVETYEQPDTNVTYFGWLCSYLPFYENTYGLKTRVRPRPGGERPYIELERSKHALCTDYHQGITPEKAQHIAESVLHDK